jgi:hypothetical protein
LRRCAVPDDKGMVQQMVAGQEVLVVMDWTAVLISVLCGVFITLVVIGVLSKLGK